MACACADGQVLLGEIVGRTVTDRHLHVSMLSADTLEVTNSITGTQDVIGKAAQPCAAYSDACVVDPCYSPLVSAVHRIAVPRSTLTLDTKNSYCSLVPLQHPTYLFAPLVTFFSFHAQCTYSFSPSKQHCSPWHSPLYTHNTFSPSKQHRSLWHSSLYMHNARCTYSFRPL